MMEGEPELQVDMEDPVEIANEHTSSNHGLSSPKIVFANESEQVKKSKGKILLIKVLGKARKKPSDKQPKRKNTNPDAPEASMEDESASVTKSGDIDLGTTSPKEKVPKQKHDTSGDAQPEEEIPKSPVTKPKRKAKAHKSESNTSLENHTEAIKDSLVKPQKETKRRKITAKKRENEKENSVVELSEVIYFA